MSITSFNFALFTIAALIVYYVLPRRPQHYWLLLLSYLFCLSWSWQFTLVLFVMTVVNFQLVQKLHQDDHKPKSWLWLGIAINLLALAYFRKTDFFVPDSSNLLASFDLKYGAGALQVLLPIGLSIIIVAVWSGCQILLIITASGQYTLVTWPD